MNAIEQVIAKHAIGRIGHPDWRAGGYMPTYFMSENNQVFCRFFPNRVTGLVSWYWFDAKTYGFRNPQLITGLDHLRELLASLKQPVSV